MTKRTQKALLAAERMPEPETPAISPEKVQILVLASGSKGNSTVIASGTRAVMIDAGISSKQAADACASLGFPLARLDGLLLTHSHTDHAAFAAQMAVEYRCKVYCSNATMAALDPQPPKWVALKAGEGYTDIEESPFSVTPFEISHDAPGSLGFLVTTNSKQIVFAHDLGCLNSDLIRKARIADALLIESNHDVAMLEASNYDEALKARIRADDGHLSNSQALEILGSCRPERLQALCLLHLSRQCNNAPTVEAVFRSRLKAMEMPAKLYLASQDRPLSIRINGAPVTEQAIVGDDRHRAERINTEVDSLVEEQRLADLEGLKRHIKFGLYFAEMRELFEAKDPTLSLCGFENFTAWIESKAQRLRVSRRQAMYWLEDALYSVRLVGEEQAEQMSVGALGALSLYAKNKNEIPPDLIEIAKEKEPGEVKREVFARLNKNGSMHFDGKAEHYVIECGHDQMESIREMLKQLKPKCHTEKEPDIIEEALAGLVIDKDNAEMEERSKIAGIASAPVFGHVEATTAEGNGGIPSAPGSDFLNAVLEEEAPDEELRS